MKMKVSKSIFIFLAISFNLFAGYIYPTFDGKRSIWLNRNYEPIVMDSGFEFGITKPTLEYEKFEFKLYSSNNIKYEFPVSDNFLVDKNDFYIKGDFVGAGNPVSPVKVYGNGIIDIYSKDFSNDSFVYMGSFQVIPEPCSILLLLTGIFIINKKVIKNG